MSLSDIAMKGVSLLCWIQQFVEVKGCKEPSSVVPVMPIPSKSSLSRESQARATVEGESDQGYFSASIISGIVGLVGITFMVMLCADNKKVNPNVNRTGPPEWTRSLGFKPELNVGFGDYSEGIHTPTPYHVIRERLGRTTTDAARWTVPISQGKHVFEVYWPAKKNRGHCCCIGLGSADVKLTKHGRCSLVGEHSQTWGLDLPKQRSFNFNKPQQKLYRGIPDRFFVYVDMDSGKIGFGDDLNVYKEQTEFFGFICHGIPKNKEMYLMISMCAPNEHVHVHYRGTAVQSGGYDLLQAPSPLQLSKDNLGGVHVVAKQTTAPPSYMDATGPQGSAAPPNQAVYFDPQGVAQSEKALAF